MSNYWYNVATDLHYVTGILTPILMLLTAGSGVVGLFYFTYYMKSTTYQTLSIPKIINIFKQIFFLSLCFSVICLAIWVLTPGGQ